ncbi:SOS response-associated peptidase [Urechidicola croceus]|uniref:Abasic site processing protein n=1 Tax=Urechidicola croceus TaxID=1850246 RepID=A0A1D8P852_9FLAO|nr:SOS response-associated peptidase [Urechidicola croceus]AOW20748.1 hypothetical protein LPB138_08695 [Urechidicola croceus]
MCYQTRITKKREELQDRFRVDISELGDFESLEVLSAFDFPKTPVITNTNPDKIQLFNWGLVPSWSQDISIRNYTLNARIETLDEKRSFKDVIQNRCLIIADGFYEWQWLTKSGSRKQKYLITLPDDELFSFPGIFTEWTDFDGQKLNSYSMVTTQANELMSEIHNTKQRMPIILKKEDEQSWLKGEEYNHFAFPYSSNIIAKPIIDNSSGQLGLFD